jgi:hypothetical protein
MTLRRFWLGGSALLWAALVTSSLAVSLPQRAGETVTQSASVAAVGQAESVPQLQETASVAISGPFANPFLAFEPTEAGTDLELANAQHLTAAAPAAYPAAAPAPPPSSSSWAPTHFEFFGNVQWRNLSNNGGFSSTYCPPAAACVTNTRSFTVDLGLNKFGVGPDFGFIWTPEKEILKAKSKIWVEWGELDRSVTHNISGSFTFNGVTYAINTTLQTQLNQNLFSLGYAGRWGNDKFRIGPEVVYQHLGVDFILTNLTPGAPPPIKQSLDVPQNLAVIGLNFDYTPVQQLDIYGSSAWIPCCGGGWHGNETEFGAKYYIRRNFSIMGGVKYVWLKRDFNAPAQEVTVGESTGTVGPFSGYIKFPGIGPFVGATYRF